MQGLERSQHGHARCTGDAAMPGAPRTAPNAVIMKSHGVYVQLSKVWISDAKDGEAHGPQEALKLVCARFTVTLGFRMLSQALASTESVRSVKTENVQMQPSSREPEEPACSTVMYSPRTVQKRRCNEPGA